MKLNLGVHNVAYSDPDVEGATTTGQVAKILEVKYNVMEVFFEAHQHEIDQQIVKHLMGIIESIGAGSPGTIQNNTRIGKIESGFRDFLNADEWQGITGRVIKAARKGVNHRLKHPYATANPPRPAFIDTGLYMRSFRAWLSK